MKLIRQVFLPTVLLWLYRDQSPKMMTKKTFVFVECNYYHTELSLLQVDCDLLESKNFSISSIASKMISITVIKVADM